MTDQPLPTQETIEHKALKGGKALMVRHGTAFLFNFGGGVLLARMLGPELMGLFYGVFAWLLIGRQVVDFGSTTHLIQRREDPDAGTLAAVFRLQGIVLGFLLAGSCLFLFSDLPVWYAKDQAVAFRWILGGATLGLAAWSFQTVSVAVMERKLAYVKVGFVEMLEPALFNILAVTLVWWKPGAPSLGVALAARGWLPALLALVLSDVRPVYRSSPGRLKALFGSVRPLVGAQVFSWTVNLMPSVLLVPMVGAAPFALVNLAYSLLGSMGFLMGIFQRIAFASFSRMHDEAGRLNRIAERLLWILCLAYIPLDFGIGGFSSFWVPLVYGDKWRGMADLMPWCVVPTVLVVFASVFYSSALAGGANRLVFKQNGLNAVLYVGVMVALAKPLGVYAWPLAQLAAVPAAWLFVRFHFNHYGKLSIARVGWGFVAGILWMASTVMLLRADRSLEAIGLAVLFLALWLWRMGKGLRLENLARKVLRSGV